MSVSFSVEEVVSVQYDEVEVALIERIIASRHIHTLGVFLVGITIHIMIADDVMFTSRETVPQVAVHLAGTIEAAEVAQFDDEIHIFVVGSLDKGCNTLFAVGNIGYMEVRCNGKSDGFLWVCLAGSESCQHH